MLLSAAIYRPLCSLGAEGLFIRINRNKCKREGLLDAKKMDEESVNPCGCLNNRH